jgi:hypothetical protein
LAYFPENLGSWRVYKHLLTKFLEDVRILKLMDKTQFEPRAKSQEPRAKKLFSPFPLCQVPFRNNSYKTAAIFLKTYAGKPLFGNSGLFF